MHADLEQVSPAHRFVAVFIQDATEGQARVPRPEGRGGVTDPCPRSLTTQLGLCGGGTADMALGQGRAHGNRRLWVSGETTRPTREIPALQGRGLGLRSCPDRQPADGHLLHVLDLFGNQAVMLDPQLQLVAPQSP